ncbi:MAG: AAA family ATPase [Candidatus Eremiobacteraeota bacterium]|nr:AAA family ATPase [Candidatus Eremiobacteraeota bacterium]
MELRIRLLGQFDAALGDRSLTKLTGARLQSLFAYLVLHAGAPQSRSQLAFLFWPDATESNARNNLRQLLHQLREALEDAQASVRTGASWVQWAPTEQCYVDVVAFEKALADAEAARSRGDAPNYRRNLERALALCDGPLVPTCYDDWIAPLRERLTRECKGAVRQLVECVEASREYVAAIPYLNHWIHHEPTDEDAYRCLMRMHALCNDRTAELRSFRACCAALRAGLDAEPSEETVRLHERIARGEVAAAKTGTSGLRAEAVSSRMIGRNDEWRVLREAWDQASAQSARLALIEGEAGIGKSRLAEELVSWASRQGVAVAAARCYAAEGRLAFAPVTDWLRSDVLSASVQRLDDVWFAEVSRVVPELAAQRSGLPQIGSGERARLFEGLARAIASAPSPLLLVIDDLQWCDLETLQWLHFFLRFDPKSALLVVGTVRSEEISRSHPVNDLRRRLREESVLTEIVLEALGQDETVELASQVANCSFDSDASARLYRETGGHPLFVVEMMRVDGGRPVAEGSNGSALPPRVHAVIAGRLAQLSPEARQVVFAAATVARACSTSLLGRIVTCGERELIVALDELWQKRVLCEQEPNVYDFTHDKLREVAYEEIGAPERRSLHRTVARALEIDEVSDLGRVSGQIAAHFDRAGLAEMAIPYYIRAATAALAVYANAEAQGLAERGLSLVSALPESSKRDAWELSLQLVMAPVLRTARGWATPEVESVLDRALALCDKVGSPEQRSQVLHGLVSMYVVQAKHDRAESVTNEISDLLRQTGGSERPAYATAMMVGGHLARGRFEQAIAEWDDVLRRFDPAQIQHLQFSQGLNYQVLTSAWQSHALWCIGRPQTALERCRASVELARDLEQPFNRAIASTYLALLLQLCGDARVFRDQADEALRLSTQFEAPYYRTWASILVAYATACDAPGDSSILAVREAIDAFAGGGARMRLTYYLALLAEVCLRAHESVRGLAVIEEALATSRQTGERWWDAELHRLRGELLLQHGAGVPEADTAYRRSLEIARAQGAKSFELRTATSVARLWRTSPQARQSNEELREVLSSFSEGFDTRDLTEAQDLLAEAVAI